MPTILLTALAMEMWAALLHRYAWHTWLWHLHRSHHRGRGDVAVTPPPHPFWEWNDALSVVHAPVAVGLILYGCMGRPSVMREVCFAVGMGQTLFGLCYILMHDGIAHARLPLQGWWRYGPVRHIARAHRVHHRTGGPPFGLFFGPWVLARMRRRAQAARRRPPVALSRSQQMPTAAVQRAMAVLPKLRHTRR